MIGTTLAGSTFVNFDDMDIHTGDDVEISVMSNMAVQAALCRLHYRRDSQPIPCWDDLEAQGKYWKRVYNTPEGRGTVEHFVRANKDVQFG